jgi:hypothetical protein
MDAPPPAMTAPSTPPPTTAPSLPLLPIPRDSERFLPASAPEGLCPRQDLSLALAQPPCRPRDCGNGHIDRTCALPPSDPSLPPPVLVREPCDGADLGGATCQSLGYAGGRLGCSSLCDFDTQECDACAPLGAGHVACARLDVSLQGYPASIAMLPDSSGVALARRGDELGIAWLSGFADESARVLHFARFRPDLTKIAESQCAGGTALGGAPHATTMRLVAHPRGWVLALQVDRGIHLQHLDPEGHPGARPGLDIAGQLLDLVERPGGEPLLLYNAGSQGTLGAIVDENDAWRGPVWITGGNEARGAFMDGSFWVVTEDQGVRDGVPGTELVRLDLDLLVRARQKLGIGRANWPALTPLGDALLLRYGGIDPRRLLWIASDGKLLSAPLPLAFPAGAPEPIPAPLRPLFAAVDGHIFMAYAAGKDQVGQGGQVYFARISKDGRFEKPPVRLSKLSAQEFHVDVEGMVSLGGDLFVLWGAGHYPGRLQLSRLRP